MRDFWKKWNEISLIKRIVVFMLIGAALGLLIPGFAVISFLGTLFVKALKAVAPILVFFLVISALANAKAEGSMKSIILMYAASTLIAALVAVSASMLFPVSITLTGVDSVNKATPTGIVEVLTNLVLNVFTNPVDALLNGNYLGILAWAVVLGMALRAASQSTRGVFSDVSDAVSQVVRWVITLAPFGIMGLVYNAVSTSGLEIFTEYGQLLLMLVGCMLVIAFITNPILVFLSIRQNPYPLVLTCLKDSGITAFFTRSSAANIPVNLELCRKLKLNKDTYSVSIPLGATINMAGAAVTISVMAMAAAYTMGISVDIPTAVILCVLAALSACGASGVAGGSLLLIPLACSLFGISNDIAMQVVGIGFIIGVIQDSMETAINSSSDVLFTASVEYHLWKKEGRPIVIPKHAVGDTDEAIMNDPISLGETEKSAEAQAAAETDSATDAKD